MRKRTMSQRSCLIFPVARLRRLMKSSRFFLKKRLSVDAAIFKAAVIEYLTKEICDISGSLALKEKRKIITPRHIMLSVANDVDMNKMLTTVIFPSSGSKMYLPLTDKKNRAYLKAAKLKDPPRHKVYGFGVPLVMSEKIISKTVIRVLNGDITKVHADAVVHPTSSRISFHGIIGSTLLSKGGSALENAVRSCIQNEGFPTYLEVRKTPAFNIGAQWILHCYSPTWRQNSNCIESDLSVAVMNCLKLCESERFCSVAFPSIGSGKAGVPKQLAAQTILQTLKNYVDARSGNTSLKVIYFVLYDRESIVVYTTELNRLI